MAAPRSWHLLVQSVEGQVQRLLRCPVCGAWVSLNEEQFAGKERLWCIGAGCGWNDVADLSTFKE